MSIVVNDVFYQIANQLVAKILGPENAGRNARLSIEICTLSHLDPIVPLLCITLLCVGGDAE